MGFWDGFRGFFDSEFFGFMVPCLTVICLFVGALFWFIGCPK